MPGSSARRQHNWDLSWACVLRAVAVTTVLSSVLTVARGTRNLDDQGVVAVSLEEGNQEIFLEEFLRLRQVLGAFFCNRQRHRENCCRTGARMCGAVTGLQASHLYLLGGCAFSDSLACGSCEVISIVTTVHHWLRLSSTNPTQLFLQDH